jgi:hypothetical protein
VLDPSPDQQSAEAAQLLAILTDPAYLHEDDEEEEQAEEEDAA